MSEYDFEPVRGLPFRPSEDEKICGKDRQIGDP